VERIGSLGSLGDRVDVLLVAVDDLVVHREAARGVDRALLRYQVAHVAIGRQHVEVLAEVLVDRLRLGRRFDDQEVLGHCCPWKRRTGGETGGAGRLYTRNRAGLSRFQWKHGRRGTVKPRPARWTTARPRWPRQGID